jgi:hypothetical protein
MAPRRRGPARRRCRAGADRLRRAVPERVHALHAHAAGPSGPDGADGHGRPAARTHRPTGESAARAAPPRRPQSLPSAVGPAAEPATRRRLPGVPVATVRAVRRHVAVGCGERARPGQVVAAVGAGASGAARMAGLGADARSGAAALRAGRRAADPPRRARLVAAGRRRTVRAARLPRQVAHPQRRRRSRSAQRRRVRTAAAQQHPPVRARADAAARAEARRRRRRAHRRQADVAAVRRLGSQPRHRTPGRSPGADRAAAAGDRAELPAVAGAVGDGPSRGDRSGPRARRRAGLAGRAGDDQQPWHDRGHVRARDRGDRAAAAASPRVLPGDRRRRRADRLDGRRRREGSCRPGRRLPRGNRGQGGVVGGGVLVAAGRAPAPRSTAPTAPAGPAPARSPDGS